jgi:hypothetical protein
LIGLLAAAVVAAAPVGNSAQEGFETAVAACESWILKPATWADHIDEFPKRAGLAESLQPQATVPDVALPPPPLRQAMHSWRVPVGSGGFFLTVSDVQPFCHIVGGGPDDLQPGAEAGLKSMLSENRWQRTKDSRQGDLISTMLVNTHFKRFTMIVTRAVTAGQRTDRVQVLATAQYDTGE